LGHNLVSVELWYTSHEGWPDWNTYFKRYIRATSVYLGSVAPNVKVLINGGPGAGVTNYQGVYSISEQGAGNIHLTILNQYDGTIV